MKGQEKVPENVERILDNMEILLQALGLNCKKVILGKPGKGKRFMTEKAFSRRISNYK